MLFPMFDHRKAGASVEAGHLSDRRFADQLERDHLIPGKALGLIAL